MSDRTTQDRPGAGAALSASLAETAGRRERRRDLRPLARLIPFVAAHRRDALCALVALICSSGATLALTAAARRVVDHGFVGGSAETIDRYFFALIGVALFLAAASATRYYFVAKLGERVVADIRKALYAHVLTLDQALFLKMRTGEVLSRITADTLIVEGMVAAQASVALRNFLMLVGATILLLVVSPKLTLGVVLIGPLVLVPLFLFGRKVRRRTAEAQDRVAEAIGLAGESLDALDTVQAFGQQPLAAARFHGAVETAFATTLSRIRARAGMTFMVIGLVFSGVVAVLWLGAQAVVQGTMSGGTLVQFVILSVLAASALGALAEVWGEVQKAAGAMERIDELLRTRPAIAAPETPVPLPYPPRGEIAFEDVVFAYPGREDLPSLNGFSLHLRPGERVALVGPSGAGKSTVLRLLLRFYDPQDGTIRLDGVDLRQADPAELRARIALVAQDAPLFSGSALDNIRFGRADATEDELREAARDAVAEGFLSALPQGLETPVGERGKSLSGGQRQRLAIARALVRRAPVLLLDEATSALDAENEQLVQRALDEAMAGRTTLVIAHRLATVLSADRIVVMDEGRVVEEGRHHELVAHGGLYARLAALQFGAGSDDHRAKEPAPDLAP